MPLITETYYLSLTQDNRGILRLRCSQDDTLRTVNLKLYNNGSIFAIPSGVSASISGVKQNGAVFSKPCTISQDRESVVLQLSSDITSVDGIIVAEIVLTDGEGGRLGTSNFIIQVEKNPIRAGVVQDTETPIEYINDFIEKIQTLTARLNNLITPSGDASLAEVVDARIGVLDSTTYQTLGARLNAEFQKLSNALTGITILESTGDATDRTSEILSKLNAYGACKLGKGDFYVNNLVMPENTQLIGSGKSTRVILPSAVTSGCIVKPRSNCIIENISFYGGFTGTYSELIASGANAQRHCIRLNAFDSVSSENVILNNIYINSFVGSAIIQGSAVGCHCEDIVIDMCYAGIDISNVSYDGQCTNVSMKNTRFGIVQNGSNFIFTNCVSKDSAYHIMSDQQNTGCTFSSCSFSESSLETTSKLASISNAREGITFDNCLFDSSLSMLLNACDGIVIKGTNFVGSDTFTITVSNGRNTLLLITDCIADVEPTVTNAGTAARITSCYLKDGTAWAISKADITVDDELSDESENPIQNKVINRAIGEIKADLVTLVNAVPVTYEGCYLNMKHSPVNISSPTFSTTGYNIWIAECSEGDRFTITATGGDSPRAYGFLDDELNVLTVAAKDTSVEKYTIEAPSGSAYLVVQDISGNGAVYKENIVDDTANLDKQISAISTIAKCRKVKVPLEAGGISADNGTKFVYKGIRQKTTLDRTTRYIRLHSQKWRPNIMFYNDVEVYKATSFIQRVSYLKNNDCFIDIEKVITDNNIQGVKAYTIVFNRMVNGVADTTTEITQADIDECASAYELYSDTTDLSSVSLKSGYGIVGRNSSTQLGKTGEATNYGVTGYIYVDGEEYNAVKVKVPSAAAYTDYGYAFYDGDENPISGKPLTYGHAGTITRVIYVPQNAKYIRLSYWIDTETYGAFECKLIKKSETHIAVVAANNSPQPDISEADYYCTGVNDEITIQAAINDSNDVLLLEGDYYIDSFPYEYPSGQYNALIFGVRPPDSPGGGNTKQVNQHIYGAGQGSNRKKYTVNDYSGGARIHVSDACYESLLTDAQYAVMAAVTQNDARVYPGVTLSVEKIAIKIPDNQKKIICIDGWNMASLSTSHVKCMAIHAGAASATGSSEIDPTLLHIPVDGCIGIRGLQGSNMGSGNVWKSGFVMGFYEGYAVCGEHLLCIDLGTRFCNYGFTINRWPQVVSVAQWIHPITMINCCDEENFNRPLFGDGYRQGRSNPSVSGRQSINIIDYNLESPAVYFNLGGDYAQEITQGTVYGEITYTGQREFGEGKNSVTLQFWESGHGHNVKTRNMAHAQSGTTAERNTYTPNYMQMYFDTTLSKMLVYDGTAWVDFNGNVVN